MLRSEALTRLGNMLASSKFPVLSAAQLDDLLLMSRVEDFYGVPADLYATWLTAHAYVLGDEVVPTARNGHFYEVTIAGAGAALEPVWPLTAGGTVVSGAVTFTEAGAAPWAGAWNLNVGAAEGWRWKAGLVASEFDFNSDVSSFSRSQMVKAFMEMAQLYDRGVLWTVDVGAGLVYDPVIGNLNAAV